MPRRRRRRRRSTRSASLPRFGGRRARGQLGVLLGFIALVLVFGRGSGDGEVLVTSAGIGPLVGSLARLVVLWGVIGGAAALASALALGWRPRLGRRSRPCPRGHGAMIRLSETADGAALSSGQRIEERVGSVDYDVWLCVHCRFQQIVPHPNPRSDYGQCPKCRHRTVPPASDGSRSCEHCPWHAAVPA